MRREYFNRDSGPRHFHSFLMALRGKKVTIFRGEPNSKTGTLVDVKSDYVTLLAQGKNEDEDPKVVFYQTQHVRSITKDTKSNSMNLKGDEENQTEYLAANNFAGLFELLMGENVEVDMGGPEVLHGHLMDFSKDLAALFTEDDGMVYINLQQVVNISMNQKPGTGTAETKHSHPHNWVKATCFQDVFSQFSHQWVSINLKGPEAMEGILVENSDGDYTIVNNQKVMRIYSFHVRSISCGPKGFMKQNNGENQFEGEQTQIAQQVEGTETQQEKSSNFETLTGTSHNRLRLNRERVTKTINYIWKG